MELILGSLISTVITDDCAFKAYAFTPHLPISLYHGSDEWGELIKSQVSFSHRLFSISPKSYCK